MIITPTSVPRIPLRRNPYFAWHLGCHFQDAEGRFRADWQLLNSEGRSVYEVLFSDGIPVEEQAPEEWTKSTRISLRDEVTHHERQRIGAPS